MIGMIMGWTMIEADGNHSVHSIRKIIVQDHVLTISQDLLLPKLMMGEVRVKDAEVIL
jgi:hypothetical protein